MKNFVRGSNIHVSIVFLDKNGNAGMPDGANITVSYVPKSNTQIMPPRSFVTLPLTAPIAPADDWTLDWDSSISAPEVVFCHAFTTDIDTPVSTIDFSFRLTANRANKELAGDDDGWMTGYWR